jgi:hypothetical protein
MTKQNEKDQTGNKVFPKTGGEESNILEDENEDYTIELDQSQIDNPSDDLKAQKNNMELTDQPSAENTEDSEWKDKFIRTRIDFFINQSGYGQFIQKFIGVMSVISSITFVVMTSYDWSVADPCCNGVKFIGTEIIAVSCPTGCDVVLDCGICNAFYYSRMPKDFELVDVLICLIYLVNYILMLFIAPSRYVFFLSNDSIKEMLIVIPVLVFPYNCDKLGLFLKATSRMFRLYKFKIFLKAKNNDTDDEADTDSNVTQQIRHMLMELVITFLMSSVLWMVLENFETSN